MSGSWDETRFGMAVEVGVLKYRPLDWFLLSGNRLVVSASLLVVVAGVVWGVVLSGLAPLTERTPILYLLFALISGNFTLITIVVSINQFVLARHLESPGEIRAGREEMVGYRREVGEAVRESVIPVTPSGFFELLFRAIARDIELLWSRDWDDDTEWGGNTVALREDVEAVLDGLGEHAEHVLGLVQGSPTGIRYALLATLDANYSRYFFGLYRLRSEYDDDLPPEVAEALDRLETNVEMVDVARRYFKTVFIQSELASLSRLLLYIGVPVQVATVVLMLLFTAADGAFLTRPVLAVVIPLVVTVGFLPITLLTAYILRLATVVQRTAAMYPFSNYEEY